MTASPRPPTTSRIGYGIRAHWAAISSSVTAARIVSRASSVDIALVVASWIVWLCSQIPSIRGDGRAGDRQPGRASLRGLRRRQARRLRHLPGRAGQISFIHTEVDEEFEGQGLGSALVAEALDDARKRDLAVLPFCPFVNSYISNHPEYLDLVPEADRKRFDL